MEAIHALGTVFRLYPSDYRSLFAAEMLSALEIAAAKHRGQGRPAFLRFVLAELIGLMRGAAAEWIAKWTTDRSVRGRCLPDLRMMRPPGVPQELWFAASSMNAGRQDQIDEAEGRPCS